MCQLKVGNVCLNCVPLTIGTCWVMKYTITGFLPMKHQSHQRYWKEEGPFMSKCWQSIESYHLIYSRSCGRVLLKIFVFHFTENKLLYLVFMDVSIKKWKKKLSLKTKCALSLLLGYCQSSDNDNLTEQVGMEVWEYSGFWCTGGDSDSQQCPLVRILTAMPISEDSDSNASLVGNLTAVPIWQECFTDGDSDRNASLVGNLTVMLHWWGFSQQCLTGGDSDSNAWLVGNLTVMPHWWHFYSNASLVGIWQQFLTGGESHSNASLLGILTAMPHGWGISQQCLIGGEYDSNASRVGNMTAMPHCWGIWQQCLTGGESHINASLVGNLTSMPHWWGFW